MPTVNLDLQLKFLNELEEALKDALERYAGDGAEKLAELKYMQREVERAKRVIAERKDVEDAPHRRYATSGYHEAVYS